MKDEMLLGFRGLWRNAGNPREADLVIPLRKNRPNEKSSGLNTPRGGALTLSKRILQFSEWFVDGHRYLVVQYPSPLRYRTFGSPRLVSHPGPGTG